MPDTPAARAYRAASKTNLFLRVGPPDASGFHPLVTLFAALDLGDHLLVEPGGEGIRFFCEADLGPPDRNLVVRAAEAAWRRWGPGPTGVALRLVKAVPAQAGLGGGSADAAATLVAMRDWLRPEAGRDEMVEVARELGADVAFFLYGGYCLGSGRGDRLMPIASEVRVPVLVVKPPVGIPTAAAYHELDQAFGWGDEGARGAAGDFWDPAGVRRDAAELTAILASGAPGGVSAAAALGRLLDSDFHDVLVDTRPVLQEVLRRVSRAGAVGRLLSGSGSAVIGLFEDPATRDAAAAAIAEALPGYFIAAAEMGGAGVTKVDPAEFPGEGVAAAAVDPGAVDAATSAGGSTDEAPGAPVEAGPRDGSPDAGRADRDPKPPRVAPVKELAILGATGSIGRSTAEVLRAHPGRFKVRSLTARRSVDAMVALIEEFQPEFVAMSDPEAAAALREKVGSACEVGGGMDACVQAATLPGLDMVVSAMVGAAGLAPVYAALEAGTDVALANKEVLVAGGEAVMALVKKSGAALLPVDSEHSALFQALGSEPTEAVRALWVTASGGPFRGYTRGQLEGVTVAQALKHPTWDMGAKITIDSASMMNKGLEVVEAHWLFGVPFEKIEVVVHPQSILHSLVEYVDGSWLAQLGVTDMKVPIQYALSYPDRWPAEYLPRLGITQLKDLTFEPADREAFENLALAYEAGRRGSTFACVLSAANEVAVEAFLDERIGFLDIAAVNREVMESHRPEDRVTLAGIERADGWARRAAAEAIAAR